MLLTALIWASAFSAIKVVVPESGPLWLAAWRVLIGFLVMFSLCAVARADLSIDREIVVSDLTDLDIQRGHTVLSDLVVGTDD